MRRTPGQQGEGENTVGVSHRGLCSVPRDRQVGREREMEKVEKEKEDVNQRIKNSEQKLETRASASTGRTEVRFM